MPLGNFYKDIPSREYHEMYIKYFFDEIYELNKLVNNLFTIVDSLTSKNFLVLLIPYEGALSLKFSFLDSKYICNEFISEDKTQTYTFIAELLHMNKLEIKNLNGIQFNDSHANEQGHIQIAKSIYKHLMKYYNEN
jgi:hypothetical protein